MFLFGSNLEIFTGTQFRVESEEALTALLELVESQEVAIISGYATTGETWTDAQNEEADHRLQQVLSNPIRITGYDPDGDHAEASWAVAMTLAEARQIGDDFKQVAIFHITEGELSVHHCAVAFSEKMGSFAERVNVV